MGAIRVKSGRLVDPFQLTLDDVQDVDFIHALSCINRFTGHVKYPYSVGQHSYVLYRHVPTGLRKAALIHDFAEVFFNDLASPVKARFLSYKQYEKAAMAVIAEYFNVSQDDLKLVSVYDKRIYVDERNALHENITERGMGDERVALDIDPWFFRERQWRDVALDLSKAMVQEFIANV